MKKVTGELRRLRPRKAAGPDGVCPRLLKACAEELGEPLQHLFNLSLQLGKVPTLWKTSCLIPIPKKPHPSELNDFRPVALTSHICKTMERLLLHIIRPQVRHALDPLQFAPGEGGRGRCHRLPNAQGSLLSGQGERCCVNHVL